MNKLFCLSIIAISFVACNSNSGGYKPAATAPSSAPAINLPANPGTASADTKKITAPTAPVPPVTQAKTTTTASAGLNPAHGQPGHRCDIPEGAPLNTPVNKNSGTPVVNQTKAVVQPQAPVKTNVRLNPEHGQPGHDCSIAVGQPLKN